MKIKVCGMCDPQNITEAARFAPDFMGFIFYEKSPRFAGGLNPDALDVLPPGTKRVGVFVNTSESEILDIAEKYKLDFIQLHGEESPALCRKLQIRYGVIKAFGIADAADFDRVSDYEGACDYYVFDTKTSGYGGSGRKFDHDLLQHYKGKTPYLLSGGISVKDIVALYPFSDERCVGFDINSQFETAPGVKDPALLKKCMEIIKNKRYEQDRQTF